LIVVSAFKFDCFIRSFDCFIENGKRIGSDALGCVRLTGILDELVMGKVWATAVYPEAFYSLSYF
jgi:hypothetical protein